MSKEVRSIPFEEFSNNIAAFFERVVRDHETVVVEDETGAAAVLKPAPASASASASASTRGRYATRGKRPTRTVRTAADREAFLSSFGGWKDLVDTDKLIENIYESRSIPNRPPVRL